MKVNYNKLWKLLIDLNMSKSQLREKSGVTTNVIAKMGKNENVSTEALCKICKALECQLDDIMELVDETGVDLENIKTKRKITSLQDLSISDLRINLIFFSLFIYGSRTHTPINLQR